MRIKRRRITVRDLTDGYEEYRETGITAYGGKLDVRPPFQREFVYNDAQRNAVINTVQRSFPLNTMYWAQSADGTFAIIDGQQRTISIARYVTGKFSVPWAGGSPKPLYFHNLPDDKREQVLGYELDVYVCSGTDSEKLDWFQVINIGGEKLTNQELRNAVFSGTWVSDARRYFSRPGCPAYGTGKPYVKGNLIRQDYLETAIKWISGGKIDDYMGKHCDDPTAVALWSHFRSVIDWVEAIFTVRRDAMRGVDWGGLYAQHKDIVLDPLRVEADTHRLMQDEDISKKGGIYPYLLDGDERHLRIRAFTKAMKAEAFERQAGVCPLCNEKFRSDEMEGDHIDPWAQGGRTVPENCQMLCRPCNRRKGSR